MLRKNKTSSGLMAILLAQIIIPSCEPECPYASKSDLYRSCAGEDDCGCITLDYSSTSEVSMDLKCREMRNFAGKTKRICTASCISTKDFSQLYDQSKAPGCTLGELSSAKCETCPGGLRFNSVPLMNYVENSVCAFLNITYNSSNPPGLESGPEGWYAPHKMYCIPYWGFAVEGELKKSYGISD